MARYALVIGISEYSDSLLPNLTKTASDAKAIAALLRESNTFQKVTVLPSPVNQQAFVQALKKFLEEADKNEALIYYTGHGITQVIEDSFGRTTKQGHLVMSDSRVTLNPQKECIAISSSIPLPEFNQVIQDSNLSNLVVLLDCCHSQYVLERGLLERLTAFSANTDYYFVAACRTTEASRAKKSEQHSVFTGALLAALAAENADEDGAVTGDRVFDCLYRGLRGLGQEPIRMGWGRSIPIVIYPEKRLEPATRFNPTNPYVGLAAFEASQQDYFFGREQAIGVLLDRMTIARFLAVTGSSGCGKSSLVKAGLLPQLATDHPIATMTPGTDPLETWQKLLQQHQTPERPIVLLIDQFEELFTLCQDAEKQQAFIQHLVAEATQTDRATQIILTIRNDFLDRCAKFPEVAALINSKAPPKLYLVPELSLAELQAAIVKPALRHGVTFAEGLAADIAAEVMDQRGSLPLLQYALTKLWDACISENSPDRLLTREAYEQIGGVNGALRDTANLLYETSSSTEQPLIRKLMLELVRVNDDQSRTRRRVSRDRLEKVVAPADQLQAILDKLTRNRLIVLDERAIEVTHEALLTEWTLLDSWIKAEQEQIYLRDQVEACYKDWQERYQRSPDALLSGALLAAVEEKLDWQHLPETEFVQQSIEHRDRSAKAQLRKQRQFFLLASALLLSITAGVFIYAQATRREAIAAKDKQAETLVSLAESLFSNHQQFEAFKTSLRALTTLGNETDLDSGKYVKRVQPILDGNLERNNWKAHSGAIYGLSLNRNFSDLSNPQEIGIVSSDRSGEVSLWSMKGRLIKSLPKQPGFVRRTVFSHKGNLVALTSEDGSIKLWNIEKSTEKIIGKHKNSAYEIAFNSQDTVLVSVGGDAIIKLWSLKDQRLLSSLNALNFISNKAQNYTILGLDIHPVQNFIAYAGRGDDAVWLWKWNSNKTPTKISSQNKAVSDLKFSPDGSQLAIADGEVIKIWMLHIDRGSAQLIAVINAHTLPIYSIAFSQKGTLLASGSADKTIKVWDLNQVVYEYKSKQVPIQESNKNVVVLQGHTSDVNRVDFLYSNNPNLLNKDIKNDQVIVSTGDDATIRIWEWKATTSSSEALSTASLLETGCKTLNKYVLNQSYISEIGCEE